MEDRSEATRLLAAWRDGDSSAFDRLTPLVYEDLRRIARRCMAREARRVTLQPTAVVHEAYLRLVRQNRAAWQSRAHFLAVAAMVMRRLLVERARRRGALKRGGAAVAVTLGDLPASHPGSAVDVIVLDRALAELAELSPRQARVVELRYFGGLTIAETARVLAVSPATVKLDWQMARAWLFDAIEGGGP